MRNSKPVILVPVASHIELECERSLNALERRGVKVWRVPGFTDISRGRSQIATDALAAGFDELVWIDSDIWFNPEDVERLQSHQKPIIGGIYPVKGHRRVACRLLEGDNQIVFGAEGGLKEVRFLATGFLYTHRSVYEKISENLGLKRCQSPSPNGLIPYFRQLGVKQTGQDELYLGEDYSFCERARQCGYQIYADTTIRLHHIGKYHYSWEDAGSTLQRYSSYRFTVGSEKPEDETGTSRQAD